MGEKTPKWVILEENAKLIGLNISMKKKTRKPSEKSIKNKGTKDTSYCQDF